MIIPYIERTTGKQEEEKVYGGHFLEYLYGRSKIGAFLASFIAHSPWISALYGFWQKLPFTKGKITPFIREYNVNSEEFLKPVQSFTSFNDFFIRELKQEARPLADSAAVIPADGRYLAYDFNRANEITVKGQTFSLEAFFNDPILAKRYQGGSLLIARLCPSDYHRFHFPFDCTPSSPQAIPGALFSVNPLALKKRPSIFWENKRVLTLLETETLGTVAFFEIGATNVGAIHQTFDAKIKQSKGREKGYFSFGGSALLLFFEQGKIRFSQDLLENTHKGFETRCLMGQPLAIS